MKYELIPQRRRRTRDPSRFIARFTARFVARFTPRWPALGWPVRWIRRHWRGDYPLWISFWLNGLPRLVAVIALKETMRGGQSLPRSPTLYQMLLLQLLIALFAWVAVGIWRSAQQHIQLTGKVFWARAAQAAVATGGVLHAASFLVNLLTIDELLNPGAGLGD